MIYCTILNIFARNLSEKKIVCSIEQLFSKIVIESLLVVYAVTIIKQIIMIISHELKSKNCTPRLEIFQNIEFR